MTVNALDSQHLRPEVRGTGHTANSCTGTIPASALATLSPTTQLGAFFRAMSMIKPPEKAVGREHQG